MSAKGKHGMKIWLDKVPTRQRNMQPFEILLSESQERMLIVVQKGKEDLVEKVFDKWDLHCAIIGEVTEGNLVQYYMNDELVAEVPADTLVLGGGAPVYQRSIKTPNYHTERDQFDIDKIALPSNYMEVAKQLVQNPNIASKRFIYKQYDSMVGINNASTNRPSDAAVIRLKDSKKGLVMTVDCNSRYVYADAYKGGAIAVSEAARNITCTGAKPVAITNCLNFGNPYDEEVYWNFVHALQGMGDACIQFETPVTGGNVSFYNQSPNRAVNPTPTIGMLGLIDDVDNIMTLDFKNEGDLIYLIGTCKNDISSSEYLVHHHKIELSPAPYFELKEEAQIQDAVAQLISNKLIQSAHDLSEGGLFIAVLESAMTRNFGFEITTCSSIRKDACLFGEGQSRVIVSIKADNKEHFENFLQTNNIPNRFLGTVKGKDISIDGENFGTIAEYKELYDTAIEKYFV
jgi:phosphoribosylformylglycinamidine synthase